MRPLYKISLIIFCSTYHLFVQAQSLYAVKSVKKYTINSGILSGQVMDKDSKTALGGATVYIPDLKLGAVADSAGHYHFSPLPSGIYLIEVHSVGFKTVTKNVNINGNTEVNFELANTAIE